MASEYTVICLEFTRRGPKLFHVEQWNEPIAACFTSFYVLYNTCLSVLRPVSSALIHALADLGLQLAELRLILEEVVKPPT